MLMDNNRQAVIENIKRFAQNGQFHNKTEITDPVLTKEEEKEITSRFINNRDKLSYKIKKFFALLIADVGTKIINSKTEIKGIKTAQTLKDGFIDTSNHFSPLENTVIRSLTKKLSFNLSVVAQTSNFAMKGFLGYIMNYADTIPISVDPRYLATSFLSVIKEKTVEKGQAVLIYPEQELWFNYRKPRPPKEGAYYFAAKLNIPVLSCFVEIRDYGKAKNGFKKTRYILHVLEVIYPEKEKTARENAFFMAQKDYEVKKAKYEEVYGKKLTYDFENGDIAGWEN